MPADFFGRGWETLTLDDVAAFLESERDEALMWEVKSDADPHSIRKQVCGFANSHMGGFLILGIAESEDGWDAVGVGLDADPAAHISSVIDDGVRPYPDGMDVKSFVLDGGKTVMIVHVPPISAPPCISRGTVYERLAGRTVAVKDSVRLSELFARGEQSRKAAEARAARVVDRIERQPWQGHSPPERSLSVRLGLSSTGYATDIGGRLFAEEFARATEALLGESLGLKSMAHGGSFQVNVWHLQDAVCMDAMPALGVTLGKRASWHAQTDWSGGVALMADIEVNSISTETLVKRFIEPAWKAAIRLLSDLDPSGTSYLRVQIDGKTIAHDAMTQQLGITLTRGPLPLEVDDGVLGSISREIDRARGSTVFEPGDA